MQLSIETRGTMEGFAPEEESGNPFAAVIAEYKRHGEKCVRRDVAERATRRTKASLYYYEQAQALERLADVSAA